MIEAAADQRMAHVRTYQTGKSSAISQKILNEISAAKICLLDPSSRTAYDASLRRQSTPNGSSGATSEVPEGELLAQLTAANSADAAPAAPRPAAKRRDARTRQTIGIVAVLLAAVGLLALWIAAGNPEKLSQDVAQPIESSTAPVTQHAEHTTEAREHVEAGQNLEEGNSACEGHPQDSAPVNGIPVVIRSSSEPRTPSLQDLAPVPPNNEPGAGPRDNNASTDPAPPSPPSLVPAQPPSAAPEPADAPAAAAAEQPHRDDSRAAMPDADALAKAAALIRDTFRDDLAGDDKTKVARSLIAAISETSVPAERASLLLTAADVAVSAGEFDLAFDAYDELARQFVFDGFDAKVDAVETAAKTVRTSDECAAAARAALRLLDEAIESERFDLGERAGKIAQAASLRTKDAELRKEVATKRANLKKRHAVHEAREKALAQAKRVLVEHPNDPAANEALGKYLAFDRNDWAKALKHLTKAGDAALRKAAAADESGSVEQAKQLGDAWWSLGGKARDEHDRDGYRSRAVFWYTRAISSLDGLQKTLLEKRIAEAGAAALAAAAEQTGGQIDKFLDIALAPGVLMRLVKIPASEDGKIKQFYLGQTEVTQQQWRAVMGDNPSDKKGERLPVGGLTYEAACRFAEKMNTDLGIRRLLFRLPKADELRHAYFAELDTKRFEQVYQQYFWLKENANGELREVAILKPNEWHLYDLLGNAWEWRDGRGIWGGSVWQPWAWFAEGPLNFQDPKEAIHAAYGMRVAADPR